MEKLSRTVMDYAFSSGACAAGIATQETLAGGPPSADLTYVLPSARSAVVFAFPLDQGAISPFLGKRDRRSHEKDNVAINLTASGTALELSNFLSQRGFRSEPVAANQVYRKDTPRGLFDLMPEIALRYLAVRSGVGHFGLSGNVITAKEGAGIIIGAAVTEAELAPTPPLPAEDSYCDNCRLCLASCISGLMDPVEMTHITLGGVTFSYAKRRSYNRCEYVCGGFAGLHPSGKWSTWSPGRFPIPEGDHAFMPALVKAVKAYAKWPARPGGFYHVVMKDKLYFTCGHCQLICHPDKEERKRRYQSLVTSGVVVQQPDGSLRVCPPGEAKTYVSGLHPEKRAMYEEDFPIK